jgi:hypothetical protein
VHKFSGSRRQHVSRTRYYRSQFHPPHQVSRRKGVRRPKADVFSTDYPSRRHWHPGGAHSGALGYLRGGGSATLRATAVISPCTKLIREACLWADLKVRRPAVPRPDTHGGPSAAPFSGLAKKCHCGPGTLCAARLSAGLSTNGALTNLRYPLDQSTMGAPGVRDRRSLEQSPLMDALQD